MSRKIQAYVPERGKRNSCRFGGTHIATNKIRDDALGEEFYLCDDHLAEYDIDNDSVPVPVVEVLEPEPKPESESESESESELESELEPE